MTGGDNSALTGVDAMPNFQIGSAGRECGKGGFPGTGYAEKSYSDCLGWLWWRGSKLTRIHVD
jgi:hypothetical protein